MSSVLDLSKFSQKELDSMKTMTEKQKAAFAMKKGQYISKERNGKKLTIDVSTNELRNKE